MRRGETSYAAPDPDLQGVGASPSLGGIAGWQFIPQVQLENNARYQFDLGSFEISAGEVATVYNLREGLTMGQTTVVVRDPGPGGDPPGDDWTYVDEKEITTPYWHFSDGFVTWGVRVYPGAPRLVGTRGNFAASGIRAYPFMGDPARLVRPSLSGFDEPLDQGSFPGQPLGALGEMPSKNFLWTYTSQTPFREPVQGPALVSFQAYVRQTNPLTRPVRFDPLVAAPSITTLQTLAFGADPEEAWLLGHLRAQYRHIAGVMLYEVHRYACITCRTCGHCCKHEHASPADTADTAPPPTLTSTTP